jgi:hypothetical protein
MAFEDVFREALDQFLAREFALVRKNAHEQALCHRLAMYVEHSANERSLDGYWVDTEYNRHGDNVKRIRHAVTGDPIPIVCDLLLHSRGELPRDNLIAVEMKKADGDHDDKRRDRERLQSLTKACTEENPDHVCGYELGYYVEIDVKAATVLIEEYRAGELTQSGTREFTRPEGPRSDSTSFAKRESRTRKSTRTKS